MIAALFVSAKGPYATMEGVDAWPESRDARLYDGPYPVVAHPPCQRWGSYATGGPSAKQRLEVGADDGCFASALASVRRWGGVLEHPAKSKAWKAHGLAKPPAAGGWVRADDVGGWTCQVEQGWYGHRARKPTWLYAVVHALPELAWGDCRNPDPPPCPWTPEQVRAFMRPPKYATQASRDERRRWLAWKESVGLKAWTIPECMNKKEREATPIDFARVLVAIALPELRWGDSQEPNPDDCPWSADDIALFSARGALRQPDRAAYWRWRACKGLRVSSQCELMCRQERERTPPEFAHLLVSIASSARTCP